MHSKLFIALTLSATLAVSLAPALNGDALSAPRSIPASPDLGMAILSANVDENGNLTGGAGAVGATKKSNGLYFVAFNRSLRSCTSLGAVSGNLGVLYQGFVSTELNSDTFNGAAYYGVSVATAGPGGVAGDRPFHVIVFCTQ